MIISTLPSFLLNTYLHQTQADIPQISTTYINLGDPLKRSWLTSRRALSVKYAFQHVG